jgi:hypothetical protein
MHISRAVLTTIALAATTSSALPNGRGGGSSTTGGNQGNQGSSDAVQSNDGTPANGQNQQQQQQGARVSRVVDPTRGGDANKQVGQQQEMINSGNQQQQPSGSGNIIGGRSHVFPVAASNDGGNQGDFGTDGTSDFSTSSENQRQNEPHSGVNGKYNQPQQKQQQHQEGRNQGRSFFPVFGGGDKKVVDRSSSSSSDNGKPNQDYQGAPNSNGERIQGSTDNVQFEQPASQAKKQSRGYANHPNEKMPGVAGNPMIERLLGGNDQPQQQGQNGGKLAPRSVNQNQGGEQSQQQQQSQAQMKAESPQGINKGGKEDKTTQTDYVQRLLEFVFGQQNSQRADGQVSQQQGTPRQFADGKDGMHPAFQHKKRSHGNHEEEEREHGDKAEMTIIRPYSISEQQQQQQQPQNGRMSMRFSKGQNQQEQGPNGQQDSHMRYDGSNPQNIPGNFHSGNPISGMKYEMPNSSNDRNGRVVQDRSVSSTPTVGNPQEMGSKTVVYDGRYHDPQSQQQQQQGWIEVQKQNGQQDQSQAAGKRQDNFNNPKKEEEQSHGRREYKGPIPSIVITQHNTGNNGGRGTTPEPESGAEEFVQSLRDNSGEQGAGRGITPEPDERVTKQQKEQQQKVNNRAIGSQGDMFSPTEERYAQVPAAQQGGSDKFQQPDIRVEGINSSQTINGEKNEDGKSAKWTAEQKKHWHECFRPPQSDKIASPEQVMDLFRFCYYTATQQRQHNME